MNFQVASGVLPCWHRLSASGSFQSGLDLNLWNAPGQALPPLKDASVYLKDGPVGFDSESILRYLLDHLAMHGAVFAARLEAAF